MRRCVCTLYGLAVVGLLVGAAAQGVPNASGEPCAGKVSEKPYCPKCDKVLAPADLKGNQCAKDDTDTVKVQVCVLDCWTFPCHPSKQGAGPGKICCGKPAEKSESEASVVSECQGCTVKSRDAKSLTHALDCKDKKVIRHCEHP